MQQYGTKENETVLLFGNKKKPCGEREREKDRESIDQSMGLCNDTISTSESEEMLSTYMVTPTTTGSPFITQRMLHVVHILHSTALSLG